jgi:O-antigen/teichoic acid export membrane protein
MSAWRRRMSRDTGAYRDSAKLIGGECAGAILQFAGLAWVAQLLGSSEFGHFVLVLGYSAVIDQICNFQSSRLVVRYGAAAIATGAKAQLAQLIKACLLLDIAGALVATAIAFTLAGPVASWLDGAAAIEYRLFSLSILFNVIGHAAGLLRLHNRFGFLGTYAGLGPGLRLAALAMVSADDTATLHDYIIAFLIADAIARIAILTRGTIEFRRLAVPNAGTLSLRRLIAAHPDILSFAVFSNLNDSVLKVIQQLDLFVIAKLLTPADAGLFRVIKALGSIPALVSGASGQVIFTNLAQLQATTSNQVAPFLRQVWAALLSIAVVGMTVYAIIGKSFVTAVFGPDFSQAYPASLVYMSGAALGLIATPLTPHLLVTGQQRRLFVAYALASAAYLFTIVIGALTGGLVGSAMAFPALYLTYVLAIWPIGLLRHLLSNSASSQRQTGQGPGNDYKDY